MRYRLSLQTPTCCLLLFKVEARGAFSSALSNRHCINIAECPLKAPLKDSRVHGCN